MSFPDATDGELVTLARDGNRDAFAQLAARYQSRLLAMARSRLAEPGLAEDAVQEALLCAFKWLHTYNSSYSYRTWICTILLNQCHRFAKKQARQAAVQLSPNGNQLEPSQILERAGRDGCPADITEAKERGEQLHRLLALLPLTQADALRLRFFGELSFPEIAAAMECGLSTAKARVRSGLAQLTVWLSDRSETPATHFSEREPS